MIQLISGIVFTSSAVFQFDLVSRNKFYSTKIWKVQRFNSFQHVRQLDNLVFLHFTTVILGMSNLFLYCFFGKLATDSYAGMAQCMYETNWQDAPAELQKYLILMIANMQKPLQFHGFNVVLIDLNTFTNVS